MRSAIFLICLVLCLKGCTSDHDFSGKYVSENPDQERVVLTLQSSGEGEWATSLESIPLRWEERDGEVWLHTKNGGVIKGEPQGNGFVFQFPGAEPLHFAKNGGQVSF